MSAWSRDRRTLKKNWIVTRDYLMIMLLVVDGVGSGGRRTKEVAEIENRPKVHQRTVPEFISFHFISSLSYNRKKPPTRLHSTHHDHPMKLMTKKCSKILQKQKSANARGSDTVGKANLLSGLLCIRRLAGFVFCGVDGQGYIFG